MDRLEHIDDQTLGSFVDCELDCAQSSAVIKAMEADPSIRDRVYQLRRAKDLIKLGYSKATPPSTSRRGQGDYPARKHRFIGAIAASLAAVAIIMGTGFLGFYYGRTTSDTANQVIASAAVEQIDRVILHIGESDQDQFAVALDYAENFIREHEARNGEIAVIAHATGIDLMRSGVSPYEGKIRKLTETNENVYFIACANAIRALRKKGVEPGMLAHVNTEKPAMDQIIERVQAGWKYIKVKSLPAET